MDTGIGFGAKVAVAVGNAKATGGGVKVGKGDGISALGVNVGKGVVVSMEGGAVVVSVSVTGGVCPQAVSRARRTIQK